MAIILPLLTTFNAAGVRAAQAELTRFGGVMAKVGKSAAVAAVAYKAASEAIEFIGESITAARDLERNMAALNTVFKDLSPQMTAFTKNAVNMGLSQVEAARTATFLGSVLKQAGLPMDEVATKTVKLTKLAQDLATTYGYDTSEALTAMTALFRGEYDPIEKFGVALKQNEVNALVAAKGLGHLTGQAMLNAQQQVRMEQLFLRSADAMGAYERQAGTLFVAQKNLNAAFENMKTVAGGPLTSVLADVFNAITPLINIAGPVLEKTFASIGEIMLMLEPLFAPLAESFRIFIELLGQLATIIEAVLHPVIGPLADSLNIVNQAMNFLVDIIAILMPVFKNLGSALEIMGLLWDIVAVGLENVLKFLKPVTDGLVAFFGQFFPYLEKATNDGVASIRRMRSELRGEWGVKYNTDSQSAIAAAVSGFDPNKAKSGSGGAGAGGGGSAARNSVKEFYANLKDEMKKQAAKLKLAKLGASEAFIDSIVGSGADWQKVFKKITAGGTAMVAKLQKQFNKTAAGLNEIKQAQEEAAKAAEEAAAKAEELKQLRAEFSSSIRAGFSTLLAKEAPALGKFQQAVVDAFAGIKQTIMDADSKILSKKKKAIFLGLAEFAQQQLENIAKQRDALAAKIESAKSFMDSVKDSIFGQVNLADMGKTSSAIIANFKRIVQRSIEFRKNIAALSQAGLNSTALQQIIAGGAEAGGSAAKALLKGGSGAISQVNDLFGQLEEVASGVSETAGQALFGAGVDASNGLINGLLAQESELQKAAETLADSFRNAFDKRLGLSKPEFSPIGVSGSTQAGTVVNLTVNAPMGTGSNIGRLIIDEISRYERTSGLVFARA